MLNLGIKNTPPYDKWDRERCIKLLKVMPREWTTRLVEMEIYQGWKEQITLILDEMHAL